MSGEKNLKKLISNLRPILNEGEYVFVSVADASIIPRNLSLVEIKEKEGITLVLSKNDADRLDLPYSYIATWITLEVHSSLEAIGLTAAFSRALAAANISCNVIAGYYHDHIFVDHKDSQLALQTLIKLSESINE